MNVLSFHIKKLEEDKQINQPQSKNEGGNNKEQQP